MSKLNWLLGKKKKGGQLGPMPPSMSAKVKNQDDRVGGPQIAPDSYKIKFDMESTLWAVRANVIKPGSDIAAHITFKDEAPQLSLIGQSLLIKGRLRCPCGQDVPFSLKFYGARGGSSELRCHCGRGFGTGFFFKDNYSEGFFLYFSPHTAARISADFDEMSLSSAGSPRPSSL